MVLFSNDLLLPDGPPPDGVLEQRPLWILALGVIGATLMLRVLGLDLVGVLISGVLLAFGVLMLMDGMQEMGRYAFLYGMLCVMSFFYDLLPLLSDIGGRVHSSAAPVAQRHGHAHIFRIAEKTSPFFDLSKGLSYNAQSLAMILSPVGMALGGYLALSAHHQIQALLPDWGDDEPLLPFGGGMQLHLNAAAGGPEQGGAAGPDAVRGARRHLPRPGVNTGFTGFTGRCHKLQDP